MLSGVLFLQALDHDALIRGGDGEVIDVQFRYAQLLVSLVEPFIILHAELLLFLQLLFYVLLQRLLLFQEGG